MDDMVIPGRLWSNGAFLIGAPPFRSDIQYVAGPDQYGGATLWVERKGGEQRKVVQEYELVEFAHDALKKIMAKCFLERFHFSVDPFDRRGRKFVSDFGKPYTITAELYDTGAVLLVRGNHNGPLWIEKYELPELVDVLDRMYNKHQVFTPEEQAKIEELRK